MLTYKQETFAVCAAGIIQNLQKRGMEGYYFSDSKSCVNQIVTMMPAGSTISWGGSESLKESGMMNALQTKDYRLIDRQTAKDPDESRELYAKTVMADYYFCSTNAITLEGELVNIDGAGNRAACLIHGPFYVMLIVGMNKVTENIETALSRVRNFAAPANAKRLDRQTPCTLNGRCSDCFSPDCICSQTVITRRSGRKGRIKIFLVGEDLGY